MRRPRVHPVVAASLFTAAAALGASCSFPRIEFQQDASGAGGSSASSVSSTSSMAESASTAGGTTSISSSSTSDSSSSTGAGGDHPENCMPRCDCDGDGYRAFNCPDTPGDDCADHDARANPGVKQFIYDGKPIIGPKRPNTTSDDFNCDNTTTYEKNAINCGLIIGSCAGDGFMEGTACGATGKLITCSLLLSGLCGATPSGDKVQGCK